MQTWKPMGRCSAQWIFTKCLQDVSKCPWLGSLRESVSECIGLLSRVLPFSTVARQASARGVLWARIPEWVAIPSPGDLSDPAIKLRDLAVQADCLPSEALIRYQGDVLSQRQAVWGRRKEGDYQQAVKGGLVRNQLTPLSWTSSLQNLRRKFGCFNHSVWVFLSWQPYRTKTVLTASNRAPLWPFSPHHKSSASQFSAVNVSPLILVWLD